MTAEIGIINQRGLTLAADSAVTLGTNLTLNNATKVFSLGDNHYIGMMIYGNAEFMGIPWEVLIKAFKEIQAKKRPLDSVPDYINSFFDFIISQDIFTKQSYENYVASYCYQFIQQKLSNVRSVDDVEDALWQAQHALKKEQKLINVDDNTFSKTYGDLVLQIFQSELGNLDQKLLDLILKVMSAYISSDVQSIDYNTGLVVAGYGKDELFPSIYQLSVDGFIFNQFKYVNESIWNTDPMKTNYTAAIAPFAQQEMIMLLLNGIDPYLNDLRERQLKSIKEKVIAQYGNDDKDHLDSLFSRAEKEFDKECESDYRGPILSMLANLSLGELANMAETMVSLTSFKRKYTGSVRTVGGPVDVLTISRDDGVVWVRKKDELKDID